MLINGYRLQGEDRCLSCFLSLFSFLIWEEIWQAIFYFILNTTTLVTGSVDIEYKSVKNENPAVNAMTHRESAMGRQLDCLLKTLISRSVIVHICSQFS